jgi:hypothetical protein
MRWDEVRCDVMWCDVMIWDEMRVYQKQKIKVYNIRFL